MQKHNDLPWMQSINEILWMSLRKGGEKILTEGMST